MTLYNLTKETKFYWRFRAKNEGEVSLWTVPWSFKTGIAGPDIPNLISPPDLTLALPLIVVLRWSPIANAETYHVQVSTDNTFSLIIFEQTDLMVPSQIVDNLTPMSLLYWRVKAKNSISESNWSNVWFFYVTTINEQ